MPYLMPLAQFAISSEFNNSTFFKFFPLDHILLGQLAITQLAVIMERCATVFAMQPGKDRCKEQQQFKT